MIHTFKELSYFATTLFIAKYNFELFRKHYLHWEHACRAPTEEKVQINDNYFIKTIRKKNIQNEMKI